MVDIKFVEASCSFKGKSNWNGSTSKFQEGVSIFNLKKELLKAIKWGSELIVGLVSFGNWIPRLQWHIEHHWIANHEGVWEA